MNCKDLWSGYKVRPTEPLYPPRDAIVKEEGIGSPPVQLQLEKVDNNLVLLISIRLFILS